MEYFLPNASEARLFDPEHADDYEHSVNCCEFPATTLQERANRQKQYLDSQPMTAYIVTNDPQEFLIELQHWISDGYFVGDSSAKLCTPTMQVAHLYRPMF